jgi:nucleoid DNA-binding protein
LKRINNLFLDQYISQLLIEHEFVIIPGFGAFLANPRQSSIDIQGNKIFPPQKKLAFNPSLTTNDGLLVHMMAQKEKISYVEAVEQINLAVSDWKLKLAACERVLLIGIGELRQNEDQKIIFSPLEKNNLLPESFGFDELTI